MNINRNGFQMNQEVWVRKKEFFLQFFCIIPAMSFNSFVFKATQKNDLGK